MVVQPFYKSFSCHGDLPVDELDHRCTIKSSIAMSRKFDRTLKIQQEALKTLTDPAVMARLFEKKPNWMPKFVWKIVVGLVIVQ